MPRAGALQEKHGHGDYLERVIELMRKGRHQCLEGICWKRKALRFVNSSHSVKLGIHNRSRTVVMGGWRQKKEKRLS